MIVCIAEKPSVAKDIANVLGATQTRQGFIEGNGYQVTWTFGHLCELKSPGEYTDRWKHWDMWDLPMIPPRFGIKLKEDKGVQAQFAVIEKLMKDADEIINCGDAGQEGELIQRWVMQKAGAKCPVKRLWISSLTEEAIREGFKCLKDQKEYQSLYEAGLSRAIGDWTLGMNATRLYTIKYGRDRQVLSIGRVQTPTLALIVRRQQEIENFVPEQYWLLSTVYRNTTFQATKGKFSTQEEGEEYLNKVKGLPFTVTDVQAKKGTEAPPRLYDLTSLQVDCNKKFGYSAEQTLQTIQSLYEKKVTTYPRVDTTFLSDDIYPKCPNILRGIRGYEQFTKPLEGKKLPKSKKVFDNSKVTDHHAIIPTGQPAQNLTDFEKKVYDLVAKAFIAVFYPDCKFLTTTVLGKVDDVEFKVTGKQITEPGWKAIYSQNNTGSDVQQNTDDSGQEQDQERTLPAFTIGESGPHEPSLMDKWTTPPKPYTEATLLRAMETAGKLVDDEELRDALKENGIGRPSTRAAIIETLFKRNYIRKERKSLIATPTGVQLIGIIHEELLKSAELTGLWEKKLRQIERHDYSATQFIDELKQMVVELIQTVRADNSNRHVETTDTSAAPAGFRPKTKRTKKSEGAPKKKAETPKVKYAQQDNKTEGAELQGDEWVGLKCPECGKGVIIKGKTAYGCSRWKEGCTFRRAFMLIISTILFLSCSNEAINFKKGEQAYSMGEYYKAAQFYRKSYQGVPTKDKVTRADRAYRMGDCYRRINNTQKAMQAYQNAVRYGHPDSTALIYLGQQYLKLASYKPAKDAFTQYLQLDPGNELARSGLLSCELAPQWKANPNLYQIKKEQNFNSTRSDFSPMLLGDESDQLVITSTRRDASGDELNGITGVKYADLFIARKDENQKWKAMESLSTVNTDYDEGVSCMSPDGKTMYFTLCSSDPDYPRNAEIWQSVRSDASWGKPTKCEITKDTLISYAHPAISPDGEWLYFVSDMEGGLGGFDIWRARILSSGFGSMENVGRPINTPGDEMFPSFRPNGDLYFSSDGHPGMGGLDILKATPDSVKGWIVENQQYPLNSNADDFGMTFEGVHNRGFFSSSRGDNNRGWENIYSFELPEIIQTVTGWVYEKDGYELPEGLVHVVGDDGTNEKLSVRGDGSFQMILKPNVKYVMLGQCKGYLNVKQEISVPQAEESEDYTLQFPLPPINIPVLIENIFYEFDKATLTPESTDALDKLVTMLNENPNITIELSSHCDYRGNDEYNKRLAQRRAESVVHYLIEHGIKSDRLTAVGYGEERPKVVRRRLAEAHDFLNEGDTLTEEFILNLKEDQQDICNALNRRTEFRVLRTTYGLSMDEMKP